MAPDPFGGFDRVSGVVLALIVLQVIATGLNLMNVSPHFSLAMWGAGADRSAGDEVFPASLSAAAGDAATQRAQARTGRPLIPFPTFAQDNANEIPDFTFTDVQ